MAEGTPEYVASVAESHTGRYLLDVPCIIPDAESPGSVDAGPRTAPPKRRDADADVLPPKARLPRREIAQGQNKRPAPPSKTSQGERLTRPG